MSEVAYPRARRKRLVVRTVAGEVLVYDLDSHRAHCLDTAMAFLWRACDGRTTLAGLARGLETELGEPVSDEVVSVGLHRLAKARLLDAPVRLPSSPARREWLRQATILGISIASIAVPTLAEAATSISNADCARRPVANCGNQPCAQNQGNTCRRSGSACSCTSN
jgi:hypothetical protein